jgi:peptidoglycan hydrolase CwlO-like protein
MLHQKVSVLEEELKNAKASHASSQSKLDKLEVEHETSINQLNSDVDHYRDLYEGLKSTVKNSEK